jgi:hypothetical protein
MCVAGNEKVKIYKTVYKKKYFIELWPYVKEKINERKSKWKYCCKIPNLPSFFSLSLSLSPPPPPKLILTFQ